MAIDTVVELIVALRAQKFQTADRAVQYIRQITANTIQVSWENTLNSQARKPTGRILLHTLRNRATAELGSLARECNGVVLHYPTWAVLSYPSCVVGTVVRRKIIVENMDAFDISAVDDGTTVTLYNYRGEWCVASAGGYDVSNYKWMGPRTYAEVMRDALDACAEFSFDALDTRKCYTIGFRHNDYHPLCADPTRAWHLQTCDLAQLNASAPRVVLLPNATGLPEQPVLQFEVAGAALFDHLAACNARALDNYLSDGVVAYGYILHARRALPGGQTCVLLESSLLRKIRTIIYNLPRNRPTEAVRITHENRMQYAALRAWLSHENKDDFATLFPQLSHFYVKFDDIFATLGLRIMHLLRLKNVELPPAETPLDARINELAHQLANRLSRINANNEHAHAIVRDYISSGNCLEMHFGCFEQF